MRRDELYGSISHCQRQAGPWSWDEEKPRRTATCYPSQGRGVPHGAHSQASPPIPGAAVLPGDRGRLPLVTGSHEVALASLWRALSFSTFCWASDHGALTDTKGAASSSTTVSWNSRGRMLRSVMHNSRWKVW